MKIATATVKAKDLSSSTPLSLKNQEVLEQLNDRIARRAYEIFERSGGVHGQHLRHWLHAEAQTLNRIPEISESSSWYTVRVPLQTFVGEDISVAVEPGRAIVVARKVSSAGGHEPSNPLSQDSLFLVANWPSEVDPATAKAYIKNEVLVLTAKRTSPSVA